MGVDRSVLDAEAVERHRAHLTRVGYRITGSLADAEDAVQEAWLRLAALGPDARAAVRDERAWLTTVVGRLCLDRLRSAAVRRERHVGPWLPEPLVTSPDADGPLDAVVQDEGVRMAAMVVLERLTPPQRVAFVLHEALELPYARIGEVLGCPEATARQHAARARRIVAGADPPPRADAAEHRAVLARFAEAMAAGDGPALVALLHPDAAWVTDSGGRGKAARQVVAGSEKVTRMLLGLLRRYEGAIVHGWEPVLVNGDPGFRFPAYEDTAAGIAVPAVRDGRITGIYQVVNPEKLGSLPR
ncbi:RNA polymerase sigma factor SigJ [Pseudonocardia sp. CNS-139]|nr:RNA polymerase sigma factor SigJ [Pseudonocardia sp. CNS-139]